MSATTSFTLVREKTIESLNIKAQEFRHSETGASHIHIASELDENVFLVALRTVPEDSKGVAHILEHTALCGSEKYPVRDPFFMMIRRSLNTFMNAFTSSDWTAYPFASENRKDYFNLLDVYLDAVFFTRLDKLDFLQEGHRVEFEKPDDATSDLVYKGVVFNEMKGALSSPIQKLWSDFTASLFETSTYHHNSGGDPKNIVDLSYEELKEFYTKHYHPSNATFMTFGNIPVLELQTKIQESVLNRFSASDDTIEISAEERWSAPKAAKSSYSVEKGESARKTHHISGWLLGQSSDLEQQLEAHLVSNLLLENSASPLRLALETTDLADSPSPLCGLEDTSREMVFVCGVEGSDPSHADDIETLIIDTLEKTANEGFKIDKVNAALHQLELSQREIGGDHYPYGLQLILGSLPAAIHRGDPLELLDINPVLERIRKKTSNAEYIPGLIRTLLLNNKHHLRFSMEPDEALASKEESVEKERLIKLKDSMSDIEKQQVIDNTEALLARQNQQDDPGILPQVTRKDVPESIHLVTPNRENSGNSYYKAGTNGLTYLQLVIDLPELSSDELAYLPLYSSLITELGIGDQDYLQIQDEQTATTGGISAWLSYKADLKDTSRLTGTFVLSGKALTSNQGKLERLLKRTLMQVRLDERHRMKDLLSQMKSRKEQSITGSGHSLAMIAAASYWSEGMALNHRLSGLEGTVWLKELYNSLESPESFDHFINVLSQIQIKLIQAPKQILLVSDQDQPIEVEIPGIGTSIKQNPIKSVVTDQQNMAWLTNTQVNFCAKAYKTVEPSHADSAALTVLSGVLRNGYLHRAIREQGGAYGGGASHDPTNGVFKFYSYRDPRLTETLEDFDASIKWILETEISEQMLEEAVLGVVSSIDKPGSPAGEAKQDFHNRIYGRTPEQRMKYRADILGVSVDDLKRVSKTWLSGKESSIAVVSNAAMEAELRELGLSIHKI